VAESHHLDLIQIEDEEENLHHHHLDLIKMAQDVE
jgi:hypothetical protein